MSHIDSAQSSINAIQVIKSYITEKWSWQNTKFINLVVDAFSLKGGLVVA